MSLIQKCKETESARKDLCSMTSYLQHYGVNLKVHTYLANHLLTKQTDQHETLQNSGR
jgi:hypothetical protein